MQQLHPATLPRHRHPPTPRHRAGPAEWRTSSLLDYCALRNCISLALVTTPSGLGSHILHFHNFHLAISRGVSKEPEIVNLDKEESVSERVARLITQQASARGGPSPDGWKKPVRQSPCLSSKSDKSTGSDMRIGSLPKHTLKSLSFTEALMSPILLRRKGREALVGRVEARKRRSKKEPEEGKDGKKKEAFIIRQSFDNIGRELISLSAATLREIGKQDVQAPTKPDETMVPPLAHLMSKVFNRCEDKQYELNSLRDWVAPMALTW